MEVLLGIEEAAARLGCSVATLRYWRHRGTGPASAKLGRRVVYRERDLEGFVAAQFERANSPQETS